MVLYIDETENSDFFIVAGIIVNNSAETENAYRKFKKSIKDIKIPEKYRAKIFTEFKSTMLDRDYKRVKIKMLESLVELEPRIVFSAYTKRLPKLNQAQKESIYIILLTGILTELDDDTLVVFDRFGKADFEHKIMSLANVITNITDIHPEDSQKQHGLQFADNICSVLRKHKSGEDEYQYFNLIEKFVKEV